MLYIITAIVASVLLAVNYLGTPEGIVPALGGDFEIEITATPLPAAELGWDIEAKLAEAEAILEKLNLKVSETERTYTEEVMTAGDLLPRRRVRTDRDRDIGLALLHVKTGDIKTLIVQKRGGELISPDGFPVEIVTRSNGIRWNGWNTQYRPPDGYIVIMNSYPDFTGETIKKTVTDARGRKKTVYEKETENFIYTPYSSELHMPELVEAGRKHIKQVVSEARTIIRNNNVPSRAYDDKFLASVDVLKPEFFYLLPLIEQTDLSEFILDPKKTAERVLVLIGANKNRAFAKTGSPAGALGWVQYTKPTYDTIRRAYPSAKLIPDFKKGAADHVNSMVAAILLHDYHLRTFISRSGEDIADDERLEEYLAAAYNGGPSRIMTSLLASIGRSDWTGGVHTETKGYVVKLRTLHSLNIME